MTMNICPRCKSENTFATGNLASDVVNGPGSHGTYPEPMHPIWECKDCGEIYH